MIGCRGTRSFWSEPSSSGRRSATSASTSRTTTAFAGACGSMSCSAPISTTCSKCAGRSADSRGPANRPSASARSGGVPLRGSGRHRASDRALLQPRAEAARLQRATFEVELGPGEQTSLFVMSPVEEGEAAGVGDFFLAYRDARRARRASTAEIATVAELQRSVR